MRGRLKLGARRADSWSMSMLPSIAASGLGLLNSADQRLAQSARTFTRSAETADTASAANAAPATSDVVDAAVGVVYARSDFQIGVKLIEVGRDVEQKLIDALA
jgi:hypothetical protein